MKPLKVWQRILYYACLGVSIEVVFTSVFNHALLIGDFRLEGKTYLWMFPIWGIGLYALEKISNLDGWKRLAWWYRLCIYGMMFMGVEALYGLIIQLIIGKIPWDYSDAFFSVYGLIRLDYFPLWGMLGLLIEKVFPVVRGIRLVQMRKEFNINLEGENNVSRSA